MKSKEVLIAQAELELAYFKEHAPESAWIAELEKLIARLER